MQGSRAARCKITLAVAVGSVVFGAGLLAAVPAAAQFDSFLDSARDSLERRLGKELDKQINPDDHRASEPPQTGAPEPAPQPRAEPAPASPAPAGDVASIQGSLNQLGYDAGPVDGLMGSRTRAAIRAWQRDNGRAVTGRPTTAVERGLQAALDRRMADTAPSASRPSASGDAHGRAGSGRASAAPAAQAPVAQANGAGPSAGGIAPRGGVAGEFERSSADRIVLLGGYRDLRGEISLDARNLHDQSMLMRIAAGQIQDPAGWGDKIFEFLPLLSRSERKAALTSAIPDRTARIHGDDRSLYAYYETIDWKPHLGDLRSVLNQFESRALQHALSTRFWPQISARAVSLPVNLRMFCMVSRPEYTFHAETWSFGPEVRKAPCVNPSVSGGWGLDGEISLDAFDTEVEMPPQQAQALYETLETRKRGDARNGDIMMVDARLERVEIDANPKARGMILRFGKEDVRATAVHIYPDPDLTPLALALARKGAGDVAQAKAPAGEPAPSASTGAASTGAGSGGGSGAEIVEVRPKSMEAYQRPAVILSCVEKADLPERYADVKRYQSNVLESHIAPEAGKWLGGMDYFVVVTTRACLQKILSGVESVGKSRQDYEIIPVGTLSKAAAPAADPAPVRTADGAGAPREIVEIRHNGIAAHKKPVVLYLCLDRAALPKRYADVHRYSTTWVEAQQADDAAMNLINTSPNATTPPNRVGVTTRACLPGVLAGIDNAGGDRGNYEIIPVGTAPAPRAQQTARAQTAAQGASDGGDLIEIFSKNLDQTRSKPTVIYACARRQQVEDVYTRADGSYPFWLHDRAFDIHMAGSMMTGSSAKRRVLVTTEGCLPDVLDKMKQVGAYPAQFNVRPASADNWL